MSKGIKCIEGSELQSEKRGGKEKSTWRGVLCVVNWEK